MAASSPGVAVNGTDVSGDGNGNFVAVWRSGVTSPRDIVGQRFDATGTRIGTAFTVNSYTALAQCNPQVVHGRDGTFFVVWSGGNEAVGDPATLIAQRMNETGSIVASQFIARTVSHISRFFCKKNKVRASATFAANVPVSGLTPETTGIRILVEGRSGGSVFDVSLAPAIYIGRGSRGWTVSGPGKWLYLDSTNSPVNGTRKVLIRAKEGRAGATDGRVKLKSQFGVHIACQELLPLALRLRIDSMDTGPSIGCGKKQFDAGRCRFKRSRKTTMACK